MRYTPKQRKKVIQKRAHRVSIQTFFRNLRIINAYTDAAHDNTTYVHMEHYFYRDKHRYNLQHYLLICPKSNLE